MLAQDRRSPVSTRLASVLPDSAIVSYPKSGRTWLRVMLGKLLCLRLGIPDQHSLRIEQLTQKAGLAPTRFTHDGSEMLRGLPYGALESDKSAFRDRRVLFLTRDLRDLMVSCYFQATRRIGRFDGGIPEFLRDERFGVRKVLTFYRQWDAARTVPKDFRHLTYETIHADPEQALTETAIWIGLEPTQEMVAEAVAFSAFDTLREMEADAYFSTNILTPATPGDPESFKVRRGKVGGYRDYLSDADVVYIDELEREMGNPFAGKPGGSVR